jgi:hypothetical protein
LVARVSKVVRSALWWQWIAALALCLTGSLLSAPARALELSWAAPPECSSAAAQRAHVDQLLARQGLGAISLVVRGSVTREHAHYRLTLHIVTPSHEAVRAVQLADCEAVDQATLALIEMALEPNLPGAAAAKGPNKLPDREGRAGPGKRGPGMTGTSRRLSTQRAAPRAAESAPVPAPPPVESARLDTPPPSEPDPAQPAPPAAPLADPARVVAQRGPAEPTIARTNREETTRQTAPPTVGKEPAEPTAPTVTPSLRAAGIAGRWGRLSPLLGVWSGGLPRPQLDAGARVGLGRGALYGELRADWMVARSDRLDWDTDGKVRIRSFALGLAGCAAFGAWAERVRVGPCARLSVLRSVGSVRQITAPRDDTVVWLASTLTALLGVRLFGPLELSIETGAGLPLSARPRFSVAGRGTAQEAQLVSLHAVLGLGLRWEQKRGATSQNQPAPPIGR